MSCRPDLPCNVKIYNHANSTSCWFCDMLQARVRIVDCYLSPEVAGHQTKIWILNHGGPDDGQTTLPGGLHLARSFFFGASSGAIKAPPDPRGHFTLRYYSDESHDDGHYGLEMFYASDTVPFALSDAMAEVTHAACLWFFDPDKLLSDPVPYRREISLEEIRERLEGYQQWIDVETAREYNQRRFRPLPPLVELPEEQKKRLVQWYDRLWWDFLEMHREYNWTPVLGFWRPDSEIIYALQGPICPITCENLQSVFGVLA